MINCWTFSTVQLQPMAWAGCLGGGGGGRQQDVIYHGIDLEAVPSLACYTKTSSDTYFCASHNLYDGTLNILHRYKFE